MSLLAASKRSIRVWKRCMALAQHCANMSQLKLIHAIFIVQGLHLNNYAVSKLVTFCSLTHSGDLSYASRIFTTIQSPNLYIYNALIRGYSRSSRPQIAIHYFRLMLKIGDPVPDHHTFHFVILASANALWVNLGKQIHCWVLKNGLFSSDSYVQTALVLLYTQCTVLVDAHNLFDEIPIKDLFQWNVLINGHVRYDSAYNALRVFRDMLVQGIEPDKFCITTGLKACAQTGALSQGKWIHEYVRKRKNMEVDVFVGTALVDMYSKCGCIAKAVEAFEEMAERNLFSWAAMIGGFAAHGNVRKALGFLERMQVEDKLKPDGIVLLQVLTAYTHAGLLEEGKNLFESMETQYGVVPGIEHYGSLVDLLCRAGRLNEALQLIKRMPVKPQASIWGALLSCCRTYFNVDLAETAVQELITLETENGTKEDGVYVQLSDIYLGAGRSEDALRIRKMIGEKGIMKTPGCSVIEVDGKLNEFVSGDASHSKRIQILSTLELLFIESMANHE